MNTYERHAYLYSSWVAVIIPAVLSMYILYGVLPDIANQYNNLIKIVETVLPVAIIFGAIGYGIRELFRSTSKIIFQFPTFKEDETRMPSTEMLLYSNKKLSENAKNLVRAYVQTDFQYQMPSKQDEIEDINEARLSVVTGFGMIKNVTRHHDIVIQSNYRYGFFRNCLGGLLWSFLITFVVVIFFLCVHSPYTCISLVALFLIVLQAILSYVFMRMAAINYARTVINHYLSQHKQ